MDSVTLQNAPNLLNGLRFTNPVPDRGSFQRTLTTDDNRITSSTVLLVLYPTGNPSLRCP